MVASTVYVFSERGRLYRLRVMMTSLCSLGIDLKSAFGTPKVEASTSLGVLPRDTETPISSRPPWCCC
jgi:hypothetical protein